MNREKRLSALAWFAWIVLAYNIGVILWGAYVRATGSGAGCGNHWPLCNGEVIPQEYSTKLMIEFTHRITSGISLVSVVALWLWCRRTVARGAAARWAALGSVLLMVNEALLGASLVLFEHVAQDKSVARGVSLSLHFGNTLLLLGAMTLTALWLTMPMEGRLEFGTRKAKVILGGLAAIILAGATGAIAALGDTLFPATSLASGIAQDFSTKSHYLLRLRLLHPATAVLAAMYLLWLITSQFLGGKQRRLAMVGVVLVLTQVGLGMLNVLLLAPVWLQMLHLCVADLMWIVVVALSSTAIESPVVHPEVAKVG